jgi:predicted PurR-regulated permease PerM
LDKFLIIAIVLFFVNIGLVLAVIFLVKAMVTSLMKFTELTNDIKSFRDYHKLSLQNIEKEIGDLEEKLLGETKIINNKLNEISKYINTIKNNIKI